MQRQAEITEMTKDVTTTLQKKKKKVWRVEAGGFKLWHPGFELV